MENKNQLIKLLQFLSLSENEVKIYMSLWELPEMNFVDLKERVKLPRTTLKENLDKLLNKGLVGKTFGAPVRYYAETQSTLESILESKKNEASRTLNELDNQIKSLAEIFINNDEDNKNVQLLIGKESVRKVYIQSLEAKKIYSIIDLDNFYKLFPTGIGLFQKASIEKISKTQYDIVFDSPFSRELYANKKQDPVYANYNVKFLPRKSDNFIFDLTIYDDNVVISDLSISEPKSVIINSKILTQSLKLVHTTLWELL